jgi:hypothetical protein
VGSLYSEVLLTNAAKMTLEGRSWEVTCQMVKWSGCIKHRFYYNTQKTIIYLNTLACFLTSNDSRNLKNAISSTKWNKV